MDFAFEFIQMFFISLWYAAPLILVLAAFILVLGHLIGLREGWSWADSIYYAFITATTVGYGDFHPKKRLSKHLAVAISLVGLVLTGIIVALALHAAGVAFKDSPDYRRMVDEIKHIEQTYD